MPDQASVGNVMLPASDVAAAVAFYRDALGLPVKFEDGTRFAALDGGGVTVAIASAEEDVTGGVVAPSFKVADIHAAVEGMVAAGAAVLKPIEEGPHEFRSVLRDPFGNVVVVYAGR